MKIEIEIPDNVPLSEVSREFLQGMADRMSTSFFKYGRVAEAYPKRVNALASLATRLDRYETSGNTEWLMDVANFAMIEFMCPAHPSAHYKPTDSKASPGRVWHGEAQGVQDRNDLSDQKGRW